MKKLIVAIILIGAIFPACKKKKVDDTPAEVKQVVVPDEYNLRFTSSLDLKKNVSGFDTVLTLSKALERYSSVKSSQEIAALVKCNNLEIFDDNYTGFFGSEESYTNISNFRNQVSVATWSVVCNEIGNFNYTDSGLIPSFPNAHSISIDTINRYEDLVVNISGAQNYDGAYLQVVRDLEFGLYNQGFEVGAASNQVTVYANAYDFDTFYNIHHVLLRLVFYKKTTQTINGKQVEFLKQAIYNYNCVLI